MYMYLNVFIFINIGSGRETLPQGTSIIEKSHHDPVYDVFWINSKTGIYINIYIYLYMNICINMNICMYM
jgi:hypothetical protein